MGDPWPIIIASGLASITATVLSNPFEVLKIRQQTSGVNCRQHHQTSYVYNYMKHRVEVGPQSHPLNNYRYLHSVAFRGPDVHITPHWWQLVLGELKGLLASKTQETNKLLRIKINQISCNCIKTNSVLQAFKQIYTKEGAKTFFNGWRYAVMQASVSNMCYFYCYENCKQILQQNEVLNDRLAMPLVASGVSRFITTSLTFPLEYWRVLQSSVNGYTSRKNLGLGTKLNSAYAVTLQRDIIFSCLFWSILENSKSELNKLQVMPKELVNLLSGIIAGVTTATITLPLDLVKTRKQVSTRVDLAVLQEGKDMNTLTLLKQIFEQEGLQGLFKGYKPRMLKVTVHAGLVYTLYEYLKELLQRPQ